MTTVLSELTAGVRTVTLNRPDRLNAISPQLVIDLNAVFDEAMADDATKAIVFRGAGRAFCAGDDLKDFDDQKGTEAEVTAMIERLQDVTRKIVLGDKIVVGAIHGWAVGGGLEWAINCDLPIWGTSGRGFFPEVNLGLFVTGAVTTLLPKLAGLHRTKELMLFGERFDAARALELGIAWKVLPDEQLFEEAQATAERIVALPYEQACNIKRVINRACHMDAEGAMALETAACTAAMLDPETEERIKAFGG
ncbi:MAG: enoyl-CoA hydratase/isomerase family protein [Alphaproteobacteria bacterium]|nr:enoyl-CoA hydratase/isomerase family protein [Alphaproteobacteria bacterium]